MVFSITIIQTRAALFEVAQPGRALARGFERSLATTSTSPNLLMIIWQRRAQAPDVKNNCLVSRPLTPASRKRPSLVCYAEKVSDGECFPQPDRRKNTTVCSAGIERLVNRLVSAAKLRDAAFGGTAGLARGLFDPTSWVQTIGCWEPRAIGRFVTPWAIVSVFSVLWTAAANFGMFQAGVQVQHLALAYSSVLTTIGFLLVFRLNRAAIRFWDSRAHWGKIVAVGRMLVGAATIHLAHAPAACDAAAAWVLAFAVATKDFLHGAPRILNPGQLAGIIPPQDIAKLSQEPHMPLYAAGCIRAAVAAGLGSTAGVGASSAGTDADGMGTIQQSIYRSSAQRRMDAHIDTLVDAMGALERIRGTPLPLVYVTHLRTSLLVYLMLMPCVYQGIWGWGTIPAVVVTSFVLLGVEGAAAECETPFTDGRFNHLRMKAYCHRMMSDATQILAQQPSQMTGMNALLEPSGSR